MMLNFRIFAVLAVPMLTLAVPTPVENPELFKRVISGAQGVDCGVTKFTAVVVEAAAQQAANYINSGVSAGRGNYPHQFYNRQGFVFLAGCNAPFYVFPIMNSGIYNGSVTGPDRVVIGSVKGTDAAFCGVLTRTGGRGPDGFLQCTVI
ncbi:hypothetical protein RSOLAG22IIIB_05122 [Rhizoctonia solani]|uniref:Uncharacterized protein n=1 Tax=Rhizoctonia solani TaxID=456999 RepID=A0A0K6G393_9AGAM|nr:hypothetical protein RSOLAG22IIIB_05122 [Rhizoctonia solani]